MGHTHKPWSILSLGPWGLAPWAGVIALVSIVILIASNGTKSSPNHPIAGDHLSAALPESPSPPVANHSSSEATDPEWLPDGLYLMGTIIKDRQPSMAVIQYADKQVLVKEGESIIHDVTLARVTQSSIRLAYQGQSWEVRLTGAGDAISAFNVIEARSVDVQAIQAETNNPASLLSHIRLRPNFTHGKPDGLKVFALQPGSSLAAIGLKRGDVIRRINGVMLSEAEQLPKMIKPGGSVRMEIVRGGEVRYINMM